MSEAGQQKAETRRRILDAAAALFRREGIDGVGVDAVMRRAGLTHGGFYGHFPSKEALAAETCADSLARSAARWAAIRDGVGGQDALERIVGSYLEQGLAAPGERGCMLTALGPELARRPGARPALTEAVRSMIETLASCLPGPKPAARQRALAGLSTMVGAVVLARLSSDPALSGEILGAAQKALGLRDPPTSSYVPGQG